MGNQWRKVAVVFLLFSIVAFSGILCTGDDADKKQQEPNPIERALGFAGIRNRWDTFASLVKLKLMEAKATFREKRSGGTRQVDSPVHPGEVVKDAATKTVESSKRTAQEAAKSAAELVDDAVHMAKEKVKKAMSSSKSSHEEL